MRKYLILILLSCTLGLHAQSQQELRDSLAAATEVLSYHPDSIDLRLRKAAWNVQLRQWEYALEEYNYVLKMEPQNVAALYFRAYVCERIKKYKFARADYESLLTIVPGHFEGRLGLALLNQKDKHFTEALDQLNMLCAQYPDRSEAFAARGGIEMERKLYDLAEYDFSQAISLDQQNVDYLLSRVSVRLKLGKKDDARQDIDTLATLGLPQNELQSLYKQAK